MMRNVGSNTNLVSKILNPLIPCILNGVMGFVSFWQVDLGQDKMVSGVVIQGGKHRDRNVFMKRFRVGHSLDGEDWTIVKEDNTTKPKVGSTRAIQTFNWHIFS